MAVMNVACYAAHHRRRALASGPPGYGAFAALMGLVLVLSVASLALQATAARRVAADPSHRDAVEMVTRTPPVVPPGPGPDRAGAVTPREPACCTSTPGSRPPCSPCPAAAYAVMGGQAGLLQGEGRWGAYAAVFSAFGLARLGVRAGRDLIWPTPARRDDRGGRSARWFRRSSGGGRCGDRARRRHPDTGSVVVVSTTRGAARGDDQQHRPSRLLRPDQPRRAAGPGGAAAASGRPLTPRARSWPRR